MEVPGSLEENAPNDLPYHEVIVKQEPGEAVAVYVPVPDFLKREMEVKGELKTKINENSTAVNWAARDEHIGDEVKLGHNSDLENVRLRASSIDTRTGCHNDDREHEVADDSNRNAKNSVRTLAPELKVGDEETADLTDAVTARDERTIGEVKHEVAENLSDDANSSAVRTLARTELNAGDEVNADLADTDFESVSCQGERNVGYEVKSASGLVSEVRAWGEHEPRDTVMKPERSEHRDSNTQPGRPTELDSETIKRIIVDPPSCEVCKKKFPSFSELNIHTRSHTGDKNYSCQLCNHKFSALSSLNIHTRSVHGDTAHCCDVCGKRFANTTSLIKHKRVHTGEKPYSCDLCEKGFRQRQHLRTHLQHHAELKRYTCDVCQKKFTRSSTLKTHKLLHTGEKPLSCSVCKKEFTQSGNLKKHERTHTGEKLFSCELCNKSFTTKHYMKIHAQIHAGIRPFSCETCGQKFSRRHHLHAHGLVHKDSSAVDKYTRTVT